MLNVFCNNIKKSAKEQKPFQVQSTKVILNYLKKKDQWNSVELFSNLILKIPYHFFHYDFVVFTNRVKIVSIRQKLVLFCLITKILHSQNVQDIFFYYWININDIVRILNFSYFLLLQRLFSLYILCLNEIPQKRFQSKKIKNLNIFILIQYLASFLSIF